MKGGNLKQELEDTRECNKMPVLMGVIWIKLIQERKHLE